MAFLAYAPLRARPFRRQQERTSPASVLGAGSPTRIDSMKSLWGSALTAYTHDTIIRTPSHGCPTHTPTRRGSGELLCFAFLASRGRWLEVGACTQPQRPLPEQMRGNTSIKLVHIYSCYSQDEYGDDAWSLYVGMYYSFNFYIKDRANSNAS
jgi:hypothetical protein